MDKSWKVYIIFLHNYSYVGATNNIPRRIRMHNGLIKGGAKYTTSKGSGWKYICYLDGFKNKIDALQFEWALKHVKPRTLRGIYGRIYKLEKLLWQEKWTSKACESLDYKLKINWCSPEYILEDFKVPDYIDMTVEDIY
jgi:putative endonuclease